MEMLGLLGAGMGQAGKTQANAQNSMAQKPVKVGEAAGVTAPFNMDMMKQLMAVGMGTTSPLGMALLGSDAPKMGGY